MADMSLFNLTLSHTRRFSIFHIRNTHRTDFALNSFYLRNSLLEGIEINKLINSWRFINYTTYYMFTHRVLYLSSLSCLLFNLCKRSGFRLIGIGVNVVKWDCYVTDLAVITTNNLCIAATTVPQVKANIADYCGNLYENLFIIYLLRKYYSLSFFKSRLRVIPLLSYKARRGDYFNVRFSFIKVQECYLNRNLSTSPIYRIRPAHLILTKVFNRLKQQWKGKRLLRLFTLHNLITAAYYIPRGAAINNQYGAYGLDTQTINNVGVFRYLNFYNLNLNRGLSDFLLSKSMRYLMRSFFTCPVILHYRQCIIPTALTPQVSKLNTNLVNSSHGSLISIYTNSGVAGLNRSFWTKNAHSYFTVLIRFLEFCTGLRALLFLERHVLRVLTTYELLICILWSKKLSFYRRLIGYNLFIGESLQILWIALKLRDPEFFLMWLKSVLSKISFWKHRLLFRYFQYIFIAAIKPYFKLLNIRGLRLTVKGKISAAGNSRKRIFRTSVGRTSFSELSNKIVYKYLQVSTFTGSLGLRFWICFNG